MSIQAVLQQLLQSGQAMARDITPSKGEGKSSGPGFGTGALAGGALGLLLGNKKFRKMGGKVAAYGGMAALGAVAYRAYQDWQNRPAPAQTATASVTPVVFQPALPAATAPAPATVLPVDEGACRTVLSAMIAAAKADGHIGPDEQELLNTEFARFQSSPQDQQWISAQLASPADPAAIARLAASPEQGAEIYLASLLVIDEESFMERAYLDELARQLGLAAELKQHLEQQARAGFSL